MQLELPVKKHAVMLRTLLMVLLFSRIFASNEDGLKFTYEGFRAANLTLHGMATITSSGLVKLTNTSSQNQIGHAFFSTPLPFNNSSSKENRTVPSFSTMFAIALVPSIPRMSGNGIAFVISPSKELPGAQPSVYLGLLNSTTNGDPSNHMLAIEFDTVQNLELGDIDDNHVGIDVNSLTSSQSSPAAYFSKAHGRFENISLANGEPLLVWVEYDGIRKQINVTIAPIHVLKPSRPLLSSTLDLSTVFLDSMYVGFSAATNTILTSHYVLGWSFMINGQATTLNLNRLPRLPHPREKSKLLTVGLPIVGVLIFLGIVISIVIQVIRKIKYAEVVEDWEIEYGPHRFSYKDLYHATEGFKEKNLLGEGGFGKVYKGLMPKTHIEVAVKRVSHSTEQGMREFVAEIASIGRIRHPNLVRLQGYIRRKRELILVYDYMINGSLEKFLYDNDKAILSWSQRFRIVRQVASGLFFLHEKWNKLVLHRDIKASNVVLDGEFNGKLGDFGLSRLYDHGSNPQTTRLMGTIGYIAPELNRTGQVSMATDVYAFGVFILEVACGRRPIQPHESDEKVILVDWVIECLSKGRIVDAADSKLVNSFEPKEMEMVLKLGLLCSHNLAAARPSMGQVVQFLNWELSLPQLSMSDISNSAASHGQGPDGLYASSSSSIESVSLLYSGC